MKQENTYEETGELTGAVGSIIFLVTGVGMAIMTLILVGVLSGTTYQLGEAKIEDLSGQVTAENFTVFNHTAHTLSHDDIVNATFVCRNYTGTTIANSNFLLDYAHLDAGSIILKTGGTYNNTGINCSFTYGQSEAEQAVRRGIISSFNALQQSGNYLPIIVLSLVIVIVLGLVLGLSTGVATGRNGGGAL